ncbi:MAG: FKBP-type peptidyl-prolyl cis-trans isomerase [bacterium]
MDHKTKNTYITIAILFAIAILALVASSGYSRGWYGNQSTAEKEQVKEVSEISKTLNLVDVKVGGGAEAVVGKAVKVNYTGTFADGKVFDTSKQAGREPLGFTVGAGQMIKGFDQGVVGMKVGGTRKMTLPPEYAYGSQAVGSIPANSTLNFEVELLEVK